MVLHNPPKHDPDMPHHEHYATEGKTKMYRPMIDNNKDLDEKRKRAEQSNRSPVLRSMKEHEHSYWEGRDHS